MIFQGQPAHPRTSMADQRLPDEEAIVDRIRERLRTSLADAPLPGAGPRPQIVPERSVEAMQLELEAMRGASDICDAQQRSYRAVLAPLVLFARRMARKLLAPTLERQVSYNLANHRLLSALQAEFYALKAEQEALRGRCEALKAELDAIRADFGPG